MDRHQYWEKLTKERDELLAKKGKLHGEKRTAYNRSITRFRELLNGPAKQTLVGYGCRIDSLGSAVSLHFVPKGPDVSDANLKALCIEIGSLQQECEVLQAEINSLQQEDFIALITPLLSSNSK